MKNSERKSTVLTRTNQIFEAEAIVAALEDAGMPAYCAPAKSTSSLAFPGALGMSEHGYEVCVLEDKLEEARELLKGIVADENSEPVEEESESYNSDNEENPQPEREYVAPEGSVEEKKNAAERDKGKSLLFTLVALIIIMLFVWLSDALISWVQGLLSC